MRLVGLAVLSLQVGADPPIMSIVGIGPGSRCSGRLDRLAHDPGVFADLADTGEAVLIEKLGCGAEEEAALCLAAGGHLGNGLDTPAAELSDLVERAFQRRPRDALTAVFLIDEEAGDPPVRGRRCVLVVFTPVLDTGEFLRAAVLAPPLCDAVLVEDQRGMRAAFADPALLAGTVARRVRPGVPGVVAHAPAAAKDPVVAFGEFGERGPRGCAERPDRIPHCPSSFGERCRPLRTPRPPWPADARARPVRSSWAGNRNRCWQTRHCCFFAASGTSPWRIHSLARAEVNSGQITTTGTS